MDTFSNEHDLDGEPTSIPFFMTGDQLHPDALRMEKDIANRRLHWYSFWNRIPHLQNINQKFDSLNMLKAEFDTTFPSKDYLSAGEIEERTSLLKSVEKQIEDCQKILTLPKGKVPNEWEESATNRFEKWKGNFLEATKEYSPEYKTEETKKLIQEVESFFSKFPRNWKDFKDREVWVKGKYWDMKMKYLKSKSSHETGIKKLKWNGSKSSFGYLFRLLRDMNLIDPPDLSDPDNDTQLAEVLLTLFEFETETEMENLRKELGSRNTLKAEKKELFKIPHLKSVLPRKTPLKGPKNTL